jgi:DNA-binding protein HU-beta
MAGKADVITAIAEQAGIADACQNGDRCAVPGLGSFHVTERKAREGRNPRTKEPINIPASRNVRFKAGKDLRDLLNVAPKKAKKR